MDRDKLKKQLRGEEDDRLFPYVDTVGKITIGVGHNLTDKGIPQGVSEILLDTDIDECIAQLHLKYRWFINLDEVRQRVLIDMCFNLGISGLNGFHATLRAIEAHHWDTAAANMLHSKWAGQVGGRAHRLAEMMRTGKDQVV